VDRLRRMRAKGVHDRATPVHVVPEGAPQHSARWRRQTGEVQSYLCVLNLSSTAAMFRLPAAGTNDFWGAWVFMVASSTNGFGIRSCTPASGARMA
jgi:hypothetical protein